MNADDLGYSEGVNRGIAETHVRGVVTSASLMVRRSAAAHAAVLAAEHPRLAVGLHFDLGEWEFRDSAWRRRGDFMLAADDVVIADEARRQLEAFRELIGRDPTHLDSHQHVHLREPARSALLELARELGVPLRHFAEKVRYCGDFYGQTAEGEPLPEKIEVKALNGILGSLSSGITELACHPGDPAGLESTYGHERGREVAALCDPEIRRTLEREGIELCSFADVS